MTFKYFYEGIFLFFSWEGEQGSVDTLGGHVSWFTEREGRCARGATEASFIWNSFGDSHEVSNETIRKYIVSVVPELRRCCDRCSLGIQAIVGDSRAININHDHVFLISSYFPD